MKPNSQWEEMEERAKNNIGRRIATEIASKETEIRKMGFASSYLEAIENSINNALQAHAKEQVEAFCEYLEETAAPSEYVNIMELDTLLAKYTGFDTLLKGYREE